MAPTNQVPNANLVKFYPSNFENVKLHIDQLYNAVNNHDQAITTLYQQLKSGVSGTGTGTSSSGTSINGNIIINGGGGGGLAGLGQVNQQSSDYTVQNTDAGGLILVSSASPVTITCASAVLTPFFCYVQNDGTADVILSPDNGLLVNGAATLTIKPEFFVILFYVNGVSWDAMTMPATTLSLETNGTPNSSQTLLNLQAGTNVTLSESSGTVTINASGTGTGWAASGTGWREDTLGNLECWGVATVAANHAKYGTVAVSFPQPFSSTTGLVIVSNPMNYPSGTQTPMDSYPTSITTTGFLANLSCSVPTGGGGDTIDGNVDISWRAIGPA